MWLICKVLIEFVTISLLFYVFVFWLQGMWDLNSLTRDQPRTSALKGKVLTTGPPGKSLDIFSFFFFFMAVLRFRIYSFNLSQFAFN